MQVLEKVAKTVSDNFKVSVVFKGGDAHTNGKRITVPHFTEEALSADENLKDALRGFVDHETGHIIYTDMDVWHDMVKAGDKGLKQFVNMIEDLRTERACCQQYNGMKKTLSKTMNHIIDTGQLRLKPALKALWIQGRREYGVDIPGESRKKIVEKEFGKGVLDEIAGLDSTAAVVEFCKRIIKNTPTEEESQNGQGGQSEQPEKGEEKEGQGEGEGSEGQGSEGQGDEGAESQGEGQGDEGAESQGEGSGEEGAESQGEGSGEEGEEGSGQGGQGGQDGEGEGGEGGEGEGEGGEEGGGGVGAGDGNSLTQGDFEGLEDPMDSVRKYVNEASKSIRDSGEYSIYDTSNDVIITVPEASNSRGYDRIKKDLGKINTAKRKIATLFNSSQAARWVGGQERGKVNARALASVPAGNKMIFKEKFQAKAKNTAVTFLMDFSGSMAGKGIEDEIESAVLFLEAFEMTGIKTELLGYTTIRKSSSYAKGFSRAESLRTYIFKTFEEPMGAKIKRRISNYKNVALANNVDGESLKLAHDRLIQRSEKRKVLIVLTDGAVAHAGNVSEGRAYLKKVANKIDKSMAVELICVDMYSGLGKNYYKNVIEIDNETPSLQETLFQEIKKILLKK